MSDAPDLQLHGRRKVFLADGASAGMDGDGDRRAGSRQMRLMALSPR